MRYFLDTEFIESGNKNPIDLISIALLAEDGRQYYAICNEFYPDRATDWVVNNVLNILPPALIDNPIVKRAKASAGIKNCWQPKTVKSLDDLTEKQQEEVLRWKSRKEIAQDLISFIFGSDERPSLDAYLGKTPEFWGEWAAYDWVVFCQIFGDMSQLPKGFPMFCNDIIQASTRLGIDISKSVSSLEVGGKHDARLGAITVYHRWKYLKTKGGTLES